MSCTCHAIDLNMKKLENVIVLNPNCDEHGYGSEWYNSKEQTEKRSKDRERLRNLQLQAREAKRKVSEDLNTDFLL
jgi:hypothetical protein